MSTLPSMSVHCGLLWALCASVASATSLQIHTEAIPIEGGKPISIEMVLIPGGTFQMGSPASEAGHEAHEGPAQAVRVNPFYLCTTEITIEFFLAYYEETHTTKKAFERAQTIKKESGGEVDAITGPTPVFGDMTMGYDHRHPAIGMTWHNAMTFCRWLAQKTGKPYRLPTEAEWEYAYRAGSQGAYGSVKDTEVLRDHAWFADNADGTNPVAQKKPNAWGLYDMGGNVSEWVLDFYSAKTYAERTPPSPVV
ncbi:MAG: SUMF1/EgtB/PvdO family nonheme iron enzyme, partial [Planctomycetes bacterium]|nr:SUMF1/EgtB/PvdO family nonheme iron enzyme [Planctomycetota bacterium]